MSAPDENSLKELKDILTALESKRPEYLRNLITLVGTVIVAVAIIAGWIKWVITTETDPLNKRFDKTDARLEKIENKTKSEDELKYMIKEVAGTEIKKHNEQGKHLK